METREIRDARKTTCDGCGCIGIYCDTSNGGRVIGGIEIQITLPGDIVLMAGKSDGSHANEVFCEDCAGSKQ